MFTLETMAEAYARLAIGKDDEIDTVGSRTPFGTAPLPEKWAPAPHDFGDYVKK